MARRRGLTLALLAIGRPGDATGAPATATTLRVRTAFRTTEVPFGEIAPAELKTGWWWGTLRGRHASGTASVSDLDRLIRGGSESAPR